MVRIVCLTCVCKHEASSRLPVCHRGVQALPKQVSAVSALRRRAHNLCRRARKGSNRSVGSAPGKPLAASSVGQAGLAWMDAAGPSTYIKELRIKDFALIDHLSIRLGPGLNVVTGESGAGKSVLVAAVTHILGAAALDDIVRPPATSAAVEAIFHLGSGSVRSIADLLVGAGLPQKAVPGNDAHSHAELLMRREVLVSEEGKLKSRCYINGNPIPLRVLRMAGEVLADVNGQGISSTLREGRTQLSLLDDVAGTAAAAKVFTETWDRMQHLQAKVGRLSDLSDDDAREALQQMIDEVQVKGIYPGEEKELKTQLRGMEERRTNVERCGMIRTVIEGTEGDGLLHALQEVRTLLAENCRQVRAHQGVVACWEACKRIICGCVGFPRLCVNGFNDPEATETVSPLLQRWLVEADQQLCAPRLASQETAMQAFGENNEQPRGLRLVEAAMQGVEEAELSLKSATRAVDQYAASFDFDAKGYEELSARAAEVSRLLRRHGCRTCEELLSEVENAQARLEEYYDLEGQRGGLEAEIDILREELKTAALEISATRRAAAARLKGSVEECLKDLGMGGACFAIDVRWEPLVAGAAPTGSSSSLQFEVKREESAETKVPPEPLGSGKVMARATREAGLDKVEFLFAAGQQEPLRPLLSVASGGEVARVMLAIKAAMAISEGATNTIPPVLILDEIDSGVGARLGAEVGSLLARMSCRGAALSQVLCITHLPQVAAHASRHLKVTKQHAADGRMKTNVEALEGDEARLAEVAAMMGVGSDMAAAEQIYRSARGVAANDAHPSVQ